MAKFTVEYDEMDIKKLILKDLTDKMDVDFSEKDLEIKVMSKQNYRVNEWENGKLKCVIDVRKQLQFEHSKELFLKKYENIPKKLRIKVVLFEYYHDKFISSGID